MRKSARSSGFDLSAFEDLAWWVKRDRKKALRVLDLIKHVHRDPFRGIGKPEPPRARVCGMLVEAH